MSESIIKWSSSQTSGTSPNKKVPNSWISPEEMKRQWKKKEFIRTLIILLISNSIAYSFIEKDVQEKERFPIIGKNYSLIQIKGNSLLKGPFKKPTPISLVTDKGQKIADAKLHFITKEEGTNILNIEVHQEKLKKLLQFREGGILAVPPITNTQAKKGNHYEIFF